MEDAVAAARFAKYRFGHGRPSRADRLHPVHPGAEARPGAGMWRRYYERWGSMTIEELGPEMIGLVQDLGVLR
ncbi:hypothetical protein ABIF63_005251 [Bradyrhizobium japonicum]|uniref:Uncharacterized protein n=1 Tax=Bradyrhizobium japonicum TaxID=375 RepID=A0ABV2RW28_BRAJP